MAKNDQKKLIIDGVYLIADSIGGKNRCIESSAEVERADRQEARDDQCPP